ncbi:MAG: fibrillarin-like rRNA/tRNA 2'-O-methyltransferase [Candidatus Aenigmarchaeota archaeon]|nr:fibrillarin-like rRNA/tRNA 2'-O-methyltransferase [Candidatus Aenigmarchaeota archaeon]
MMRRRRIPVTRQRSKESVRPFNDLDGVYSIDGRLATVNLMPGVRVYGEDLVKIGRTEYRIWDNYRSKPAAALKKKLKVFPLKKGMTVLYLGAASGTTVSHFSDIVGKDGVIYGIDIAERVLRELIHHAELRGNIVPILADAKLPGKYAGQVFGQVDMVFEDVAAKDQVEILVRNSDTFLQPGGYAMIAIKSQSIDVTKPPKEIYAECLAELEKHFEILDKVELDPFEKFHMFVVLKKK